MISGISNFIINITDLTAEDGTLQDTVGLSGAFKVKPKTRIVEKQNQYHPQYRIC